MAIESAVTRRTLLVAGAATAGVAALAACSSSDDTQQSSAPSEPGQGSSSSESSAPSSESAGSAGSSAPESSGSSAAANPDALASLADLTVGEPTEVKLPDGKTGLLTKTSATAAVCFSNVCTHQGCSVKPEGKQLDCPCHGSSFNATTGAVLGGPAPSPLPKIAVKVVDGQVVAG